MNKKQADFLRRYNIEIVEGKEFGDLAIQALKTFSPDRVCLSTKYVKATTKYKWQCRKCAHIWEANWNNTMKGRRCPRCTKKTVFLGDLQSMARRKGGKLLSTEYVLCDTKYEWECSEGHIWKTSWDLVKQGNWCPKCAGVVAPSIGEMEDMVGSRGGRVINPESYENNRTKLRIICPKNHEFDMSWRDLKAGNWCKRCSRNGTSRQEAEIASLFESPVVNVKPPFLDGLELDIFLPSKNMAIEHHGLMWHSSRFVKDETKLRSAHKRKQELCHKAGIKLVQIFGDEWINKKDIVISILKAKSGMIQESLYARKCKFVEISRKEGDAFFEANHVSGSTRAVKYFALEYEGEVVSCLSLRKPFTKKYVNTIEIARFCSKTNIRVVGGLSKLLSNMEKHLTEYSQILTYADLRFGTGNGYLKAGFELIGKTAPNYFYVNNRGLREGRFKHRKKNDPEFIKKYGNTEITQNKSLGWYRIYDAGSNIYVKKLSHI